MQANLNLLHLDKKLLIHDFNVDANQENVKDFASALAGKVEKERASHALADFRPRRLLTPMRPRPICRFTSWRPGLLWR